MNLFQEINQKVREKRISMKNLMDSGIEERNRSAGKTKMHGTTILAMKYENGVIMAADRRCVSGETIFTDEMVKIEEIEYLSCIAGAGWVSDFQILVELLKKDIIPKLENYWKTEIFVDGQANILKYIMRNALFLTWPILAGWDPYEKRGRIFIVEPGGAFFESSDSNCFAASGSGEIHALAVLRKEWSKDYSEKNGVRTAIKALLAASTGDRNTSDPFRNPPIVKIISPKKISTLSEEESLKIAWGQVTEEQMKRGNKKGVGMFIAKSFLKEKRKKNDNPKS